MTGEIRALLLDLREGLQALYGRRLRGTYLYGSYARGEAEGESDLDLLIVLDQLDSYGTEIDRTSKLVSTLSLRYGVSVSRAFVSELEWKKAEGPFLATVRKESIPA